MSIFIDKIIYFKYIMSSAIQYNCTNVLNLNKDSEKAYNVNQIKIMEILIAMEKVINSEEVNKQIASLNELIPITEVDKPKIIAFVKSKSKIFDTTLRVYQEQATVLRKATATTCTNLYKAMISENGIQVISVFIGHFPDIKSQQHFYIAKDIYYILKKYLGGEPELKDSAILLHSFCAFIFGSEWWCTSPLAKMQDILEKSGFVIITNESPSTQGPLQEIRKRLASEEMRRTYCYVRGAANTCVKSSSMNTLWGGPDKYNIVSKTDTKTIGRGASAKSVTYISEIVATKKDVSTSAPTSTLPAPTLPASTLLVSSPAPEPAPTPLSEPVPAPALIPLAPPLIPLAPPLLGGANYAYKYHKYKMKYLQLKAQY
jgi:hypothetical protein